MEKDDKGKLFATQFIRRRQNINISNRQKEKRRKVD
jgi:hypothetical protein